MVGANLFERSEKLLGRFLCHAILITWAVVCLLPNYWIIATSIKQPLDVINGPRFLPLVDFWPSVESWKFILFNPTDDTLGRYANSILVAIASTAATVLIGASAAYGLCRLKNFADRRIDRSVRSRCRSPSNRRLDRTGFCHSGGSRGSVDRHLRTDLQAAEG